MRDLDERELMQQVARREPDAIAEAVRRYLPAVYSSARRQLRDAHAADDVCQAVFLTFFAKAPRFDNRIVPLGWLFKATRYACANSLKMQKRRDRHERTAAEVRPTMTYSTDEVEVRDLLPLLDEAIASLNQRDRDAILLRYIQGASLAQIGSRIGLSEDSARKVVERAVEKLRKFCDSRGAVAPTAVVCTVLAHHLIQDPPAALAGTITSVSLAPATAATTTVAIAQGTTIAMQTFSIKTAAIIVLACGATVAAASSAVVWLTHRAMPAVQQAAIAPQASILAAESVNTEDTAKANELLQKGWKLWQQQQYAAAGDAFKESVELNPKLADAWNGLGWSKFNSGEPQNAYEPFEKAIEIVPLHPAALNGLGQLYLLDGDLREGERYLAKAAPSAPAAWYGLTRIYLIQDRFDDALVYAKKLSANKQMSEGDPVLPRMLEAAQNKQIDDTFRNEIGPFKEDSRLVMQAWTAMDKNELDQAGTFVDQAIQSSPENPVVVNAAAWRALKQGAATTAQADFEKVYQLRPGYWSAVNGLAQCYQSAGRSDEAVELWKKMLMVFPKSEARRELGLEYVERGQFAEAIPLLEGAVKDLPGDPALSAALDKAKQGSKK